MFQLLKKIVECSGHEETQELEQFLDKQIGFIDKNNNRKTKRRMSARRAGIIELVHELLMHDRALTLLDISAEIHSLYDTEYIDDRTIFRAIQFLVDNGIAATVETSRGTGYYLREDEEYEILLNLPKSKE